MKAGDMVRMKPMPGTVTTQQVWCIKAVKNDHRATWIQVDENPDVWRDSRIFEVISEN